MRRHISTRRTFLRAAGIASIVAASAPIRRVLADTHSQSDLGASIDWSNLANISFNEIYGSPPLLGRVHGAYWVRIFNEPSPTSGSVRTVYWGYVMPIYRSLRGDRYDATTGSNIWFETDGGYAHSAYVVPSQEMFQPFLPVPEDGFWGEVSVPLVQQFQTPALNARRWDWDYYKNYWGQVHRVVERAEDKEGRGWYRIHDDIEEKRQAWVPARTLRKVQPEEFDPISPYVPVEQKRILIDLGAQRLVCYESDKPVFHTRIATGSVFTNDEGEAFDLSTSIGSYRVERKRPSRRMRGAFDLGLGYDVNGVPWVTYFGTTGAAIHGAYWHNNFGSPRSHGCINVTPDAAKWVYRWTQPFVGYDDIYRWTELGEPATTVRVI